MNQVINCSVNSCRHHSSGNVCSLNSIQVGCGTTTPHNCAETECDSFEE